MQSVLELKEICKSFQDGDQQQIVLDHLNLQVNEGEFVAIVGPSGSGKSTLLTIAGMMLTPDSGEVVIAGQSMSHLKQAEWTSIRNKHLGFIFQNHQLFPYLKGREQLTEFLGKGVTVDADKLLADLDLSHCANKYPAKMSGGERQRLAIARAFASQPDLILADEPTASLDAKRGRQVVEMIRKEVKKQQKAAVMVTHDERVLDLVDKVYRLVDGKLTEEK